MEQLIRKIIFYWNEGYSYNDSINKACSNLNPEEKEKILKELEKFKDG
ncbi:MAG: hypothetical protein ACRCUM_02485 [Mycoplasmoidaceae bacterium]